MTADGPVFSAASPTRALLEATASRARCAVICGVPGMGKSLLLREQARIAAAHGRTVHRLQWDVARQPFERADILTRYPEIAGATHPVIRRAAGLWVRRAVADWWQSHPEPAHLLLIEAPLVGGRFSELLQRRPDAAEGCLTAPETLFLVPVPSCEVRAAIEAARARDTAASTPARDTASAIPVLVDALWQELMAAARDLAVPASETSREYSPELYAALHRRLLRHRQMREVPVAEVVKRPDAPPAAASAPLDLAPEASEVSALIEAAEAEGVQNVVDAAAVWYRV